AIHVIVVHLSCGTSRIRSGWEQVYAVEFLVAPQISKPVVGEVEVASTLLSQLRHESVASQCHGRLRSRRTTLVHEVQRGRNRTCCLGDDVPGLEATCKANPRTRKQGRAWNTVVERCVRCGRQRRTVTSGPILYSRHSRVVRHRFEWCEQEPSVAPSSHAVPHAVVLAGGVGGVVRVELEVVRNLCGESTGFGLLVPVQRRTSGANPREVDNGVCC